MAACSSDQREVVPPSDSFVMGADLSYVNQLLDFGGQYADASGTPQDPYALFADIGTDWVRLRLWHDPLWTRDIYGNAGTQMYSDLEDVKLAALKAKNQGMEVLLDIHYSDTWADPGQQELPAAWARLSLNEVEQKVEEYTYQVLAEMQAAGCLPLAVQVGNEINTGMLFPHGALFPEGSGTANPEGLRKMLIAGLKGIARAEDAFGVEIQSVIHCAQPEHTDWFFSTVFGNAPLDFDILGVSFYPAGSSRSIADMGNAIRNLKSKYAKEVMVLEVAYPWTLDYADHNNNILWADDLINGYPASPEGQLTFFRDFCQEVKSAGGSGVIYWEPGWISTDAKTPGGKGSAWENATFFDFKNENRLLPIREVFGEF
ncbi:arabinogalactan endo-beta-1,4-galactanase [Persicobacter diffluens]|uniref:Arabinogalactan endo-beta-1,4-galactanase n=2 Tax=Persicobacter diffluens TaxID=981 RepID=A0AAN4W1J9_9BACT|nr:arabinogalactan endo-beta-1,4-galactanase [Persicobacter diffluens]